MKNLKFLIFLIVACITSNGFINSNGSSSPAAPRSATFEDQPATLKKDTEAAVSGAETAASEALTGFEADVASYFEERVKKSPFKASVKPGVCLFAGLQEYRFPECAGETGDELKNCCSKKTKDDIDVSKTIASMGTPDWMKNNSTFSQAGNFFATPVVSTKKSK